MYQNNDGGDTGARPPRQMFDVTDLNLTCAECNVAITELPFRPTTKPDGTYGKIYCRECNKQRQPRRPAPFSRPFRRSA